MVRVIFLATASAALMTYLVGAAPTPTESAPLAKRTDHYGIATYYEQGGAAGSCGTVHSDSDYIAALGPYWNVPANYCGRTIQVKNNGGGQQNPGTGNTVTVTVADTCPSCDENHLDLSEGAFKALTNGNLDPPGKFNIVWHFV